jgi:membrane-associated protein
MSPNFMGNITSLLLSYVLIYKYLAIFVITYLGAIAFPLPSGTVVMASAAFATQGYLSFPLVLLVGILGNVAGDNSGYWLARRYGVRALHMLGLKKVVGSEKYNSIHREVNNHLIIVIYFSRFMTGIAPAVNVISGTTNLAYKRFLVFEVLGECTEVSFFASIGFAFGANWEYFSRFAGDSWIIILSGLVFAYLVLHYFFKNKSSLKIINK